MQKIRRVILIVMDSVGIGELPDAGEYGDIGADTLGHAAKAVGGVSLPNLESLGLGKLTVLRDEKPSHKDPAGKNILGSYGKMAEASKGKDTTVGHWEMMGVIVKKPFPLYPDGFPPSVINKFETDIGRKTLGNKPASGTEIIQELGEQHCKTGFPIVYTSQDSVFQIAAHEDVIPLDDLYAMCKIARKILCGDHAVGRVIARPFTGKPGSFTRTRNRHDFSLEPAGETVLDRIKSEGLDSIGVGKIKDIFAGRGLTAHVNAGTNEEVLQAVAEGLANPGFKKGLLFANLVDFDMLYNHRQDPAGLIKALGVFDRFLPQLFDAMKEDDALFITADHGNDPTDHSTDHCREYVPIMACGARIAKGKNLGVRKSFADCGKTISEMLGVKLLPAGVSFAKEILV